jgi:hypothetical protein
VVQHLVEMGVRILCVFNVRPAVATPGIFDGNADDARTALGLIDEMNEIESFVENTFFSYKSILGDWQRMTIDRGRKSRFHIADSCTNATRHPQSESIAACPVHSRGHGSSRRDTEVTGAS